MIVVFGGTTEGKRVAAYLDTKGLRYIYSTKTQTGSFPMQCGRYRSGPLDERGMELLFRTENVVAVIDAAHPFASLLHETIAALCRRLSLPVIRFERNYDIAGEALATGAVHYADSFSDAVDLLRRLSPKCVLASTGVQTIRVLKPYWSEHEMKIRILPSNRSLRLAHEEGFPSGDLVPLKPSGSLEEERRLIMEYGIDCLLVKESGASGFLPVKIRAAADCGIGVVVVRRPELPDSFIMVSNEIELNRELERLSESCHEER